MMKKQATQKCRTILHEFSPKTGKHRIVILGDGTPDASPWWENHEIGTYKGLNASLAESEAIPLGIFRTVKVDYRGLSS